MDKIEVSWKLDRANSVLFLSDVPQNQYKVILEEWPADKDDYDTEDVQFVNNHLGKVAFYNGSFSNLINTVKDLISMNMKPEATKLVKDKTDMSLKDCKCFVDAVIAGKYPNTDTITDIRLIHMVYVAANKNTLPQLIQYLSEHKLKIVKEDV